MSGVRLTVAGLLVLGLGLAGAAGADDKDSIKDKIVGTWVVTKVADKGPPKGATIVFTKDGKATFTVKRDDKVHKHEGTYVVEGNKIKLTEKRGDKEHIETITVKKV